jgi:hypothetical protein
MALYHLSHSISKRSIFFIAQLVSYSEKFFLQTTGSTPTSSLQAYVTVDNRSPLKERKERCKPIDSTGRQQDIYSAESGLVALSTCGWFPEQNWHEQREHNAVASEVFSLRIEYVLLCSVCRVEYVTWKNAMHKYKHISQKSNFGANLSFWEKIW